MQVVLSTGYCASATLMLLMTLLKKLKRARVLRFKYIFVFVTKNIVNYRRSDEPSYLRSDESLSLECRSKHP